MKANRIKSIGRESYKTFCSTCKDRRKLCVPDNNHTHPSENRHGKFWGGEGFSKPKTSEFRGVGRRLNQKQSYAGEVYGYMGIIWFKTMVEHAARLFL